MRKIAPVVTSLVIAACTTAPSVVVDHEAPSGSSEHGFRAEIRRTAYGVPHITAPDMGGIGYGYGYASAQDNICEIADRLLTVSAERSRFLGPGANGRNISSDLYHQRMIQSRRVEALLEGPTGSADTPSAEAKALAEGYAAGINRYLREVGVDNIGDPRCSGAPWVREITALDFWRHMYVGQTVDGLFGPTTRAAPPSDSRAAGRAADLPVDGFAVGSNAYAIGREMTKNGRGVLLGNPHYPWDGVNRFYRTHFIIPGDLNIVGMSYIGMPLIRIGHNDRLAWSNTVSTARRSGYFELQLNPDDPTEYLYEGDWVPMGREEVTIEVKRRSGMETLTRTLYSSRFGPLIASQSFPWSRDRAFALHTFEVGLRDPDQYIAVWRAKSVREMKAVLARWQSFRFNTTAVDASGEALYGDLGMMPNVSLRLAEECSISEVARRQWRRNRVPVLDGSRAACQWTTDPDSSIPGAAGASRTPHQFRTDYVLQSNDSYWLTNVEVPLVGYSPIFGDEETPRSLRTRVAHDQVAQRVAGTDGFEGKGFDLETMQQVMFSNRHYGAELVRNDLVSTCRSSGVASLEDACEVLAAWDMKVNLDSRGAHLFHLFAAAGGLTFKDSFDPKDPVHTPHTLDTGDAAVLLALKKAVAQLEELRIPLDARLGDVQAETRNGERIPIHGGDGRHGVFNVVSASDLLPERGWTNVRSGASWIYVVEFTDDGPRSQGLLTYSQSTDPTSPQYSDQTWLYSRKGWDDLLFTEEALAEGTVSRLSLSQ